MRAACILMILLLPVHLAGFATAAASCAPGLAEAAPGLELNIDITEDSVEAQVTESAPGTATFHGTVTVQMPTVRGAEVTLTSSVDIGWVSQISPSTMELTNGETATFTATVIVPQGSPASQTGTLTVNGRAVASGVQATDADTALVTVQAYYRLALDTGRRTVEIAPGGTARFPVRLTNAGNAMDSYSIQYTNLDELKKAGWSLAQTTTLLENLEPAESRMVTIALTAPVSLSPYMSRETALTMRALSEGARSQDMNVTLDYPLVVKEVGVSGAGVGAVVILVAVVAVGVVLYRRRKRRMQAKAGEEAPAQPPEASP